MANEQVRQDTVESARGVDVDKRNAILEAARALFTTDGYEQTTIAQVARRAGVAVGTVYLYFKNKSDLLSGVKDNWEQEVLRSLLRPELAEIPFHLRARPMLEAAFSICATHTNMVQLMGLQAEMIGHWAKVPAPILEALKAFLEEGKAKGALRPVDAEIAAVAVYGMVNGALLQCFLIEGGLHQRRYIDTLVDAVNNWLVNPDLLR